MDLSWSKMESIATSPDVWKPKWVLFLERQRRSIPVRSTTWRQVTPAAGRLLHRMVPWQWGTCSCSLWAAHCLFSCCSRASTRMREEASNTRDHAPFVCQVPVSVHKMECTRKRKKIMTHPPASQPARTDRLLHVRDQTNHHPMLPSLVFLSAL